MQYSPYAFTCLEYATNVKAYKLVNTEVYDYNPLTLRPKIEQCVTVSFKRTL